MSSSKDSSKENSSKDKSRVVKFAAVEADQALWQAVEKKLGEQAQGNFSELCKQALHQYLMAQSSTSTAPAPETAPEVSVLQRQVVTLQKQIRALQLQIAKLEGAIGMQQNLSLGTLEQHLAQLEQRVMQQSEQFIDRLNQLESQKAASSPAAAEPVELDPVLTRLVPLLEDF